MAQKGFHGATFGKFKKILSEMVKSHLKFSKTKVALNI